MITPMLTRGSPVSILLMRFRPTPTRVAKFAWVILRDFRAAAKSEPICVSATIASLGIIDPFWLLMYHTWCIKLPKASHVIHLNICIL